MGLHCQLLDNFKRPSVVWCSLYWPVRAYAWGTAEALASAHSDVPALRRLLIELAFDDLKARTEERYHAYRSARLQQRLPDGACPAVAFPPLPCPASTAPAGVHGGLHTTRAGHGICSFGLGIIGQGVCLYAAYRAACQAVGCVHLRRRGFHG